MPQARKPAAKKTTPAAATPYQENPGWGNVFFREDAQGNQPKYTGQVLDLEGNELSIAIWPRVASTGTKYLRVHLEEVYNPDPAQTPQEDDDDIPF